MKMISSRMEHVSLKIDEKQKLDYEALAKLLSVETGMRHTLSDVIRQRLLFGNALHELGVRNKSDLNEMRRRFFLVEEGATEVVLESNEDAPLTLAQVEAMLDVLLE